jgi:hypothetical protein
MQLFFSAKHYFIEGVDAIETFSAFLHAKSFGTYQFPDRVLSAGTLKGWQRRRRQRRQHYRLQSGFEL